MKKIIMSALDEGDWLNASIGLLNRGVEIGECRKLLEWKKSDIDNALSGKAFREKKFSRNGKTVP